MCDSPVRPFVHVTRTGVPRTASNVAAGQLRKLGKSVPSAVRAWPPYAQTFVCG